jgi:ABC-type oligopeptide transport system substrate-binding subunit
MRLGVLTMSLLLLVFGCGKKQEIACIVGNQEVIVGGESGQELSPTQVFRKNNGTEPGTLDPHRAEGVPASNVLRDLFEGLVMEDPSGRYVPGAAESWTLAEDAKTYVFTMRENGKWSNGDDVTADDFVYGLRRSVDPSTLSNYSSMLYPIKNARNIVKAIGPLTGHLQTEAVVGSKTITIIPTEKLEIGDIIKFKLLEDLPPKVRSELVAGNIKEKDLPELKGYKIKELEFSRNKGNINHCIRWIIATLSECNVTLTFESSILMPLSPGSTIYRAARLRELGVRAEGQRALIIELEEPTPYFLSLLTHSTTYATHRPTIEKFGARFTRPGNLVGNGAFKLEEWRVQSHIKLVRNTEYWDNKNTTLEEVYYYPLDDVNSSFKRYRAQELDFTETVPHTSEVIITALTTHNHLLKTNQN